MRIIYLYTPMCGTCQLAEKLLSYVEGLIDTEIEKYNINFQRELAATHRVESVPCLLKINEDHVEKLYAFSDVTTLYQWLKPNHSKEE